MDNKSEKEIRNVVRLMMKNSDALEDVGITISSVAKDCRKRLSRIDSREIDLLNEERVPIEVAEFLKKKTNIDIFVDYTRKEIVKKLISEKKVKTIDIIRYSTFFNSKLAQAIRPKTYNVMRMVFTLILEEENFNRESIQVLVDSFSKWFQQE